MPLGAPLQSNKTDTGSTSTATVTCTFTSAITAGSTLVAGFGSGGLSGDAPAITVSSISDTKGNNWVVANGLQKDGNFYRQWLYKAEGAAAAAANANTLSVTFSASVGFTYLMVAELPALNGALSLDGNFGTNGNGTSALFTCPKAEQIAYAVSLFAWDNGQEVVGTAWTLIQDCSTAAALLQYQLVGYCGPVQVSSAGNTSVGSGPWIGNSATFAPGTTARAGLAYADRVQETSTTTGAGAMTLAGATAAHQSFASAFSNGQRVYYLITDGSTGYETGLGTLNTSAGTLSRDVVLTSSNSGALVSWASGTKTISCVEPASAVVDQGLATAVRGKQS